MEIPELRKISDKVNDKVDDLRHSETLRSAVDRSEEGFNQFTNALFSGIKSFFTQPEAKEGKEDKHRSAGSARRYRWGISNETNYNLPMSPRKRTYPLRPCPVLLTTPA